MFNIFKKSKPIRRIHVDNSYSTYDLSDGAGRIDSLLTDGPRYSNVYCNQRYKASAVLTIVLNDGGELKITVNDESDTMVNAKSGVLNAEWDVNGAGFLRIGPYYLPKDTIKRMTFGDINIESIGEDNYTLDLELNSFEIETDEKAVIKSKTESKIFSTREEAEKYRMDCFQGAQEEAKLAWKWLNYE